MAEVRKQLYSHSLQDANKVYAKLCALPFLLGMERQYQIVSELLRRGGSRLKLREINGALKACYLSRVQFHVTAEKT